MSIIKELKLSDKKVNKIVLEWYTTIYPDILQNEDGRDLEEILEEDV